VINTNVNGFSQGFMTGEEDTDCDFKTLLKISSKMSKKRKVKKKAKKKLLAEKRQELARLENEKKQREKEERDRGWKEQMENLTQKQLELQKRQSSLEFSHEDSDRTVQEKLRSLSNSMEEITGDHIDVKNLVSVLQELSERNRDDISRNRDDINSNTNQIGVNMAKIQENERRIENMDRQLQTLCELRTTLRLQSGQSEVTSRELAELQREFVTQMALIQREREIVQASVVENQQLIRETREVYGGQLQRTQTVIEDEVQSLQRQVTEIQTDLRKETKPSGLAIGVRPGTNVSAMGPSVSANAHGGLGVSNGFAGATIIPVQDDRKLKELQKRIDSLEKANSDINDKFSLQDAMIMHNDRIQSEEREKIFRKLLADNEDMRKELEANKRVNSGVTELSKRIKESEEEVKELREIYGSKFVELEDMVEGVKLESEHAREDRWRAGEAIQLLDDKITHTTQEQEDLRARQDQLEENFDQLSDKPGPTSDSDNLKEQVSALTKRQEEFEEEVKSKFEDTAARQNAFEGDVVHSFQNVANMRDNLMQRQGELQDKYKKFESVDDFLNALTKRFDAQSLHVSSTLAELNKAKEEQDVKINDIKATIEVLQESGPRTGNEPQDSISELRTELLEVMQKQAVTLADLESNCATKKELNETATAFNDLIVDTNDLEEIQKKMEEIEKDYATKEDLKETQTVFNQLMADTDDLDDLREEHEKAFQARLKDQELLNKSLEDHERRLKKFCEEYEELSVNANTMKLLIKDMGLRQRALEKTQKDMQKQLDAVGPMIDEELKKSESSLKTFFAQAFQKVPRPTAFAEKKKYGGIRTRITVKFQCPCGCSEEFHFKTYHYNKWFKFALIGFKSLISLKFTEFPGIAIHKAFEDIKATRKGQPIDWIPGEDFQAPEAWLNAPRLWPQEKEALETELLEKVGKLYRSDGTIEEVNFYKVMKYNADWMWFLSNSSQHLDIQPPDRYQSITLTDKQHCLPMTSYALKQDPSQALKPTSTKPPDFNQEEEVRNILLNPIDDVVESIGTEDLKAAQLKEFLRFAKMENLIASWVKEEIDLDDLIESDELDEDLIDLGLIKKGPRMKFKKAMKKWKRLDSQKLY